MKTYIKNPLGLSVLTAALGLILAERMPAQTFATLHSFTPSYTNPPIFSNSDGTHPYAGLILSGNTLYGTAQSGGGSNVGIVFAVHTDGSGFTNLHSFNGGSDGAYPVAGLILSNNTLYGTAQSGGSSGVGTVFAVNTDGTGFTNLHSFNGNDGASPVAGLILSSNTLYGTAQNGGSSGYGTVFAVNIDGVGFRTVYSFTGDNDGANPVADLILSGNTLYGMAKSGGISGVGTLFAVNTDGTSFTDLHDFTYSDGAYPVAGLILSGETLYGTAQGGGSWGYGTVFGVGTDGTGFTNLYSFTGYPSIGGHPFGGLTLSSNTLFGTAQGGGSSGNGTVFAIHTDGSSFTNLYNFTAGPGYFPNTSNSDGAYPFASLVLSGNTLYGTTYGGGSSGNGTLFGLNTDGTGFTNLHTFTVILISYPLPTNTDGAQPWARLVLSGNTLYGTTLGGGSASNGIVFGLNTDGSGFTNLHNFTGGSDGAMPVANLTLSGDTLYGTTQRGSSNNGTVFKINTDGTGFTNLHKFTGSSAGAFPYGGLILSGDMLYGTTSGGGASGDGTIFAVNTNGTVFKYVHIFTTAYTNFSDARTNSEGANPVANLILSEDTLYGTAYYGGTFGNGAVFKVNTNGTSFTNLHSFAASHTNSSGVFTNNDGARPSAGLVRSGDTLYGTTQQGGSSGGGTVFAVNANGTDFRNLHSFNSTSEGNWPAGDLILLGNMLYGTTVFGGSSGAGTVFAINTGDTGFRMVHSFDYTKDGAHAVAGLILSGNTLYGSAMDGGSSGNGTVFSLLLLPQLTIMPSRDNVILTWPTNAAGFTLQSATDLVVPVWTTNSPGPVVVNGQNTVTNPISGRQQFYRLIQ